MSELEALRAERDYFRSRLVSAGLLPREVRLPNDEQVQQLIGVVLDAYPALVPSTDQDKFTEQFRRGLLALSHMGRRERPDTERYPYFWCDLAQSWLKKFDLPHEIGLLAFIAAAVASDVVVGGTDDFRYASLGLHQGSPPRPLTSWEAVLERRKVLPASELKNKIPARHVDIVLRPQPRGSW